MKNPADISKNRIFLPSDVFACFCWNQSMQKHPIYTVLRNTSLPLFKYFKIIIIVSEFQESHLERCGFKSWNVPAQVWSPGGKSWRLCYTPLQWRSQARAWGAQARATSLCARAIFFNGVIFSVSASLYRAQLLVTELRYNISF